MRESIRERESFITYNIVPEKIRKKLKNIAIFFFFTTTSRADLDIVQSYDGDYFVFIMTFQSLFYTPSL